MVVSILNDGSGIYNDKNLFFNFLTSTIHVIEQNGGRIKGISPMGSFDDV